MAKKNKFKTEDHGAVEVYRDVVWVEGCAPRRVYQAIKSGDNVCLVIEKDVIVLSKAAGSASAMAKAVATSLSSEAGMLAVTRQLKTVGDGKRFNYALMEITPEGAMALVKAGIKGYNKAMKAASAVAKEKETGMLPSAATLGIVYVPKNVAKNAGFASEFLTWIRSQVVQGDK